MKVKQAIKELVDCPNKEIYLDTMEGEQLLKLDEIYVNDEGKVVLYGSIFNMDNKVE